MVLIKATRSTLMHMPAVFIVFFIGCLTDAKAQIVYSKKHIVAKVLDSLSAATFSDTARYSRADLVHSSLLTENTRSYAPLFVVNDKYCYMLDIVDGSAVTEFVREFLTASKVKSVALFNPAEGEAIYGKRALNGVVLINTKKMNVNYHVAGLSAGNKNNFDQRQDGEIRINN